MVFEIFSYWNMRELELVFNAVAAIVGSGDYLGLLRTIAVVGLLSMAMAVLAGFSQLPDFGRWIIMLAVFNGMLLVPKVTVVLTDRTGTEAPRTVANVPIGLAAFAHSVSHIGDWLTTTFETTFSLPNDIQFRTNGALFGHRVQQEILHTKFDNSILNSNLLEFYRECIVPEFATGYIIASDMAKSNDIWTYLSGKTNPGRLVTLRAVPGSTPAADTYGCDVAYTHLGTQITYVNTQQMNALGKRLYPGRPTAAANAAVQSSIQTSTNYMLGISTSATDITKQTAMSNFMIDAQYMLPAQIGDAAGAAANLAQAQAIRSTSESYKLMAKIGESTMPKIKNIVEIVQYSIFPIIILLVLMAGHKGGLVLKAYVMSLVWVQLWPPLYAILHMVMTIHSQELAAMTSGMGLSMAEYNLVNNAYISDEAIAGMIAATAIPMIASAIVKGGDVGASAMGSAISSSSQQATQAATAASQGNFSMGNASLGNQSADNLSMGQVNARPTLTQGGASMAGADGVQRFYGTDASGNAFAAVNAATAMHNLPFKAQLGNKQTASLKHEQETAEKAAVAASTTAAKEERAGFTGGLSFAQGRTKSDGSHDTSMTGSQVQFSQAATTAKQIIDSAAKGRNLTQSQMAELYASAGVTASGGVNIPLVGGVNASASAGGKTSTGSSTAQVEEVKKQLANSKELKNAVTAMQTASQQKDFVSGDAATRQAAQTIQSDFSKARTHREEAKAQYEKADIFKTELVSAREGSGSFATDNTIQFMNWATKQKAEHGGNYSEGELTEYALGRGGEKGDKVIGDLEDRFIKEKMMPEFQNIIGVPENNIKSIAAGNESTIPDPNAHLQGFKNENDKKVTGVQQNAGVDPDKRPVNTVTPEVKKLMGQAEKGLADAGKGINAEGDPLKKEVNQKTDPTANSNVLNAGANAISMLTPDGTSKLIKDGGLMPDNASVGNQTADNYKGSTKDAIIDTAIFAGSMAVGGVGGKVIGKTAGVELNVAKKTGDAAYSTTINVASATERRVAAQGLEKEAAALATPEVQAATKAAAAKAGAKAEVGAQQTVEGMGKIGGGIVGGVTANQLTGEQGALNQPIVQPAIEAVKKTDAAVLDMVSDAGNKTKETLSPTTKK